MKVTIYHNPDCGTSRNTLALIRNAGIEPVVIEYLKTPPDRATLTGLIAGSGLRVRDAIRQKGTPYAEMGLDAPSTTDAALLDAMLAHPILINRPFVASPLGVRLCRPSERVLDILSEPQRGAFIKEDGERVIGTDGKRVPHD
ncbi:MAG: arsenate reductase (glutaredoxin) [Janthinobacterium lividum]